MFYVRAYTSTYRHTDNITGTAGFCATAYTVYNVKQKRVWKLGIIFTDITLQKHVACSLLVISLAGNQLNLLGLLPTQGLE